MFNLLKLNKNFEITSYSFDFKAANACRYWPKGRGIYHNKDKTFLVWVNEEDHMRIISMQNGGDVGTVLNRLIRAVKVN